MELMELWNVLFSFGIGMNARVREMREPSLAKHNYGDNHSIRLEGASATSMNNFLLRFNMTTNHSKCSDEREEWEKGELSDTCSQWWQTNKCFAWSHRRYLHNKMLLLYCDWIAYPNKNEALYLQIELVVAIAIAKKNLENQKSVFFHQSCDF